MNPTKRFLLDLAERVGRTFVQVYGAWFVANGADWIHLSSLDGLKVAAAASVLALLMGLGFRGVGDTRSASLLPSTTKEDIDLLQSTIRQARQDAAKDTIQALAANDLTVAGPTIPPVTLGQPGDVRGGVDLGSAK